MSPTKRLGCAKRGGGGLGVGVLIKIIDNGFNYRQIRSREIAPVQENMRQKSCNVLTQCLSLLCLLFLDTVIPRPSAFCMLPSL